MVILEYVITKRSKAKQRTQTVASVNASTYLPSRTADGALRSAGKDAAVAAFETKARLGDVTTKTKTMKVCALLDGHCYLKHCWHWRLLRFRFERRGGCQFQDGVVAGADAAVGEEVVENAAFGLAVAAAAAAAAAAASASAVSSPPESSVAPPPLRQLAAPAPPASPSPFFPLPPSVGGNTQRRH